MSKKDCTRSFKMIALFRAHLIRVREGTSMANQQHNDLLKQGGVRIWNTWRKKHPEIQPDLRKADFHGVKLNGVNFHRANLEGVNLHKAILNTARLSSAELSGADLSQANLSYADLSDTHFNRTNLDGTNLAHVTLRDTEFAHVDLSTAKGLDTVRHVGPSTIGLDTIHCSKGTIPENFLRGIGVPEIFLSYIRAQGDAPFDYFTCFISYSSEDEIFVKRLHDDLQHRGVRCWYASDDLKPGDNFRAYIDNAIRRYDKLLLVLSKHSIASGWVEYEVGVALQKEHNRNHPVLFPIRLDSTVMNCATGWAASIQSKRHIGNFEQWKQQDVYRKALNRLLRDLKVEV